MKIMLMTDLEGVAGVLNNHDWTSPEGRFNLKGMTLLTEEVNAAVDGLFAGGADEIVVIDGHGSGAIDPEILDERAQLSRGRCEHVWPWGLDNSFHALGFIGQHAKAGTPYSHITHTQNMRYIDLSINGVSIGEYGQLALCAMQLGIPTILACGEQALASEAEALTPGVITVAVKRGLLPDGLDHLSAEDYRKAKLSAIHVSPKRSRAMIRESALKAIEKFKSDPKSFGYPELTAPYVRIARFRAFEDKLPYRAQDEHPNSIIALMNMPFTPVEA